MKLYILVFPAINMLLQPRNSDLRMRKSNFRLSSMMLIHENTYPALGSTAIARGLSKLFHINALRCFPSIFKTLISLKSQSVQ